MPTQLLYYGVKYASVHSHLRAKRHVQPQNKYVWFSCHSFFLPFLPFQYCTGVQNMLFLWFSNKIM